MTDPARHDASGASRGAQALRAVGWGLGVLGALGGLLGPVLARAADPTSLVGLISGSGACLMGAVIIDRRPRNRAAWGFQAGGLLLVAFSLCYSWAAGRVRQGMTGGAVGTVAVIAEIIGTLAGGSLPLFQLLFPDGRLPSRGWRPVFALYLAGWVGGAVVVAITLWPHRTAAVIEDNGDFGLSIPAELDGPLRVIGATEGFAALAMLTGVVAVAVRLRRSRGIERSQILLTIWGLALTAALIGATALFAGHPIENVTSLVAPLPLLLTVTVAMRRHQLFDVDRLVGRTITYAAITALMVGVYALVAVGAGALAGELGLGSSWAVAAATLTAAMVFRPLLRLVRTVVDRRFDRRTWLAVHTIEEFTRALRAGTASPAGLLQAIRQAIDDPTATVVYLDGNATIDVSGAAVPDEPAASGRLRHQVRAGGAAVAVVEMDGRLAEEPRLVEAALGSAALPLENAALHARAAVRLAEVAASRNRIVAAEDSNRRRIERDLHDGPQQRLVALALRLRMAERELRPTSRRAADMLGGAVTELRSTVEELRELTRGILPPALTDEGLAVALRTAVAGLPVPVTLDVTARRLPPVLEATVWFFACEGLANAVKHANAAQLAVSVTDRPGTVRVEVRDDGTGGALLVPLGGLQGLADRVAAVNGTMTVESSPGTGTTVRADLPHG